jgi:hypothetical protein
MRRASIAAALIAKGSVHRLTAKQKAELYAVCRNRPPGLSHDDAIAWAYERVFEPYVEAATIKKDIAALEAENRVFTRDERRQILGLCERACQWHQSGIPELGRRELRQARFLIQRGVARTTKQNTRAFAIQAIKGIVQKTKDKKKRDVMAKNREAKLKRARDKHRQWQSAADATKKRHPKWSRLGVARQVQKDLDLKENIRTIERAIKK